MALDKIEIKRKRSKYIEKEIIVPGSHTEIFLNERGKRILRELDKIPEIERELSLDLTGGGGYDLDEGVIYIMHDEPVYKRWRKIQKLFSQFEKQLGR
jgi:hypothetical protein